MKNHILEIRKLIPQKHCDKIIKYFGDDLKDAEVGTPNQKIKIDKNNK